MRILTIIFAATVVGTVHSDQESKNTPKLTETVTQISSEPLPTPESLTFLIPTFWKPTQVERRPERDQIQRRIDDFGRRNYDRQTSRYRDRNSYSGGARRRQNFRPTFKHGLRRRQDEVDDLIYYDRVLPEREFMLDRAESRETSRKYEIKRPNQLHVDEVKNFRQTDGTLDGALNYLWSHKENRYSNLFKSLDLVFNVKEEFIPKNDVSRLGKSRSRTNSVLHRRRIPNNYKKQRRLIPDWQMELRYRSPHSRRTQTRLHRKTFIQQVDPWDAPRRGKRDALSGRTARRIPHFQMVRDVRPNSVASTDKKDFEPSVVRVSIVDKKDDVIASDPSEKTDQLSDQDAEELDYDVEIVELDESQPNSAFLIDRMDSPNPLFQQHIEKPIFKGTIRKNIINSLDRLKGAVNTRIRPELTKTTNNFLNFLGQRFSNLRFPGKPENYGFKPMTAPQIYSGPKPGQSGYRLHDFGDHGSGQNYQTPGHHSYKGGSISGGHHHGSNHGHTSGHGLVNKYHISGHLRNAKNSVNRFVNSVANRLPGLGKSITVMSFLAFSVFVANLGVNALTNSTFLINTGRNSPNYLEGFDLDGMISDLADLFEEDFFPYADDGDPNSSRELIIESIANIGAALYDDLQLIASIGIQNFGRGPTKPTDEHKLEGEKEYPYISKFYKDSLDDLDPECYQLLICETYRLLAIKNADSQVFKLLPFWTYGVSWLDKGAAETVNLLENLRASIAGQAEKHCPDVIQCPDRRTVNRMIGQAEHDIREEILPLALGKNPKSHSDENDTHEFEPLLERQPMVKIPDKDPYPKVIVFDAKVPLEFTAYNKNFPPKSQDIPNNPSLFFKKSQDVTYNYPSSPFKKPMDSSIVSISKGIVSKL